MALVGAGLGLWLSRNRPETSFSPRALASPMMLSLGLWLVLSFYWSCAARGASPVRTQESPASRQLHLLMVNAAQILSFWPFAGWPRATWKYFEFPRVVPETPWLAPAGLAVGTLSLLLAFWARHQLGRNWSGAVTVKVDHELVRSGPYRWIRHPIYTGAIGMYVGTAFISGRLQGLLAVGIICAAYARKIGMEERNLRQLFGTDYADYQRRSWALLPWVV